MAINEHVAGVLLGKTNFLYVRQVRVSLLQTRTRQTRREKGIRHVFHTRKDPWPQRVVLLLVSPH